MSPRGGGLGRCAGRRAGVTTIAPRARRDRRWLWLVSTRLHDRFEDRAAKVLMQDGVRATLRYKDLGSVLYYLQRVTIPANVVPIFHPSALALALGDRFTDYPIDEGRLSEAGDGLCGPWRRLRYPTFDALLAQTAGATLDALRQPIADMQSPWYAFWELGSPGALAATGEAGNRFGRAASFPCGTDRCQLLDDDPIYATFAAAQHRLALLATMRGILLLQRDRGGRAMRRGGDLPQGLRRRAWARLALQGLALLSLAPAWPRSASMWSRKIRAAAFAIWCSISPLSPSIGPCPRPLTRADTGAVSAHYLVPDLSKPHLFRHQWPAFSCGRRTPRLGMRGAASGQGDGPE